MSNSHIPTILTDNGLSLFVNDIKFRNLDILHTDIPLNDLIWHFEMPVWETDGTDDWNLTPQQVIDKEEGTKEHQKKVEDADLQYPIIVTKYKDKFVILDGVHRLAKAHMKGDKTIKAKIIPQELLELRKK